MGATSRAFSVLLALLFVLTPLSLLPVGHSPVMDASAGTVPIASAARASDGYGYDPATATFVDHNGFAYSYLPDGVIKLVLPWGYTTYFSYGLTGTYLGVAQKVTALSYTWTWTAEAREVFDSGGNLTGYDYSFIATNSATLAWTIRLDFFSDSGQHMKVTHSVKNGYPAAILGAEFWYLFDLTHTPSPSVTTNSGTYYPPLYSDLPDSITWARLSNQFQFDWREAGWPNGHAYLGSGSVVGLPIDILGISLDLGEVSAGETVTVDPYFSGVTRTWAATGNSYSGIAANWSPAGVPATGDNITFDATSTFNCIWNTSVTLGIMMIAATYTGTITQSVDYTCWNFIWAAGTYTSSPTGKWLTIQNNYTRTGGSLSGYTVNARFSGPTTNCSTSTSNSFRSVTIDGYLHLKNYIVVGGYLNVSAGATLSVEYATSAGLGVLLAYSYASGQIFNDGTITGPGKILLSLFGRDSGLNIGSCSNRISIETHSVSAGANRVCTLTGPLQGVSSVSVQSNHTTYTCTLIQNGQTISTGTNGFLVGGKGIVILDSTTVATSGNWDSSAGTVNWGTSTLNMTGTSKTLKTAIGSQPYNLQVPGTISTTSSLNITHGLSIYAGGSLTIGAGKYLNWSGGGSWLNAGSIAGTGTCYMGLNRTDLSITAGTITAPLTVRTLVNANASRTLSMASAWSIATSMTLDSESALYGLTFDTNGYGLTVNGATYDLTVASDADLVADAGFTIGDDCAVLGTITTDGAAIDIGGNLNLTGTGTLEASTATVTGYVNLSGAADLTTTDTVLSFDGGLWTAPGTTWAHDDSPISCADDWQVNGAWTLGYAVVTLTGTGILDMASTNAFWNITIGIAATITMDNDTYVDLRATIDGTMAGAGDFIEPEPAFWTLPDLTATPLQTYEYAIDQAYWDTLAIEDGPAWLSLYGSSLMGVPTEADAGLVNVSLSLTWNDMTIYQNYTLLVSYPAVSEGLDLTLQVILAVILGLSLLLIGLIFQMPHFTAFSGIVWLWAGLAVFSELTFGWTAISIFIGFATLVIGGMQYDKQA